MGHGGSHIEPLVHPRIPLNGCLDIKPLSLSILWKGGRSTAAQTTHVRAKALEAVREGEQDRWFGREQHLEATLAVGRR